MRPRIASPFHPAWIASAIVILVTACVPMVVRYPQSDAKQDTLPAFHRIQSVVILESLPLPSLRYPTRRRSENIWRTYNEIWMGMAASFPNARVRLPGSLGEIGPTAGETLSAKAIEDVDPIRITIRSPKSYGSPALYSCILTLVTFGLFPCYGTLVNHVVYELDLPRHGAGQETHTFEYDLTRQVFGGWIFAAVFLSLDEVSIPSDVPESDAILIKNLTAIREMNQQFLRDAKPLLERFAGALPDPR